MTSAPNAERLEQGLGSITNFLGRVEQWLDDHGKGAWIAAMVLGFVFFWPAGLAILAYMIWSKRMFSHSNCRKRGRYGSPEEWDAMKQSWHEYGRTMREMGRSMRPTGNATFDAYKTETITRLMEEQKAFEAFLQRLREAKDKEEFDRFMDERARAAGAAEMTPAAGSETPEPPPAA